MSNYLNSSLVNNIYSLLGILELAKSSQVYQDAIASGYFLANPNYQIAVFGPFNHGKSTLLNALLGKKTLPIDLIPTTGAAIYINYGDELKTNITLKDGREIIQEGTKVLQEYAILDEDRRMREDVVEVRVFCNHPFLKTGVEFLDLPGTNDRESQDDLVKDKLLGADLIVHVLDARKLMTLAEREKLRDWLQDRGINTVIFAVNFLNLLTAEERKEVQNRLRFVAQSFRSQLPNGISNLYCIDALPALRARLKGNTADAQTAGLTEFESALQNIVEACKQQKSIRFSRVVNIANNLIQLGKEKQQAIALKIETEKQHQQQQIIIKQKASKLIEQGLTRTVSNFQGWLYLPKLLEQEQAKLAIALQRREFNIWQQQFQASVSEYQQSINDWVAKGCEFFKQDNPDKLLISFPAPPEINIAAAKLENNQTKKNNFVDTIPIGLDLIKQRKVKTLILGGASYVIDKVASRLETLSDSATTSPQPKIDSQVYVDAATDYLTQFSDRAFATLKEYEAQGISVISYISESTNDRETNSSYQLQLLSNLLTQLEAELNSTVPF